MTYTRRHLPHWSPPEKEIFITWRLHGSLPRHFALQTKTQSRTCALTNSRIASNPLIAGNSRAFSNPAKPSNPQSAGEAFVQFDRALDTAASGPLWLKNPRVAESVLRTLLAIERNNLAIMRAYVVMANHVHVLLTPRAPLAKITSRVKGASARAANRILNRSGERFWQDESFDHWVRNPAEAQKIRAYIERNPVTAGLVPSPEDWPWSSASRTGFSLSAFDFQ